MTKQTKYILIGSSLLVVGLLIKKFLFPTADEQQETAEELPGGGGGGIYPTTPNSEVVARTKVKNNGPEKGNQYSNGILSNVKSGAKPSTYNGIQLPVRPTTSVPSTGFGLGRQTQVPGRTTVGRALNGKAAVNDASERMNSFDGNESEYLVNPIYL